MKLQFKGIEAFVKKPPAHVLAILIYGPDEGLIRERSSVLVKGAGVDEKDPFAISNISQGQLTDNPALLLDEAKSISMLGGRRVVRLRLIDNPDRATAAAEAALKQLKDGDNLVIIEAGELGPRSSLRVLFERLENAAALPCYVEDERDLTRLVSEVLKSQGFRISSEAMSFFAISVIGDRAVARGETEKLITYMGGQRDIALEDVMACVGAGGQLPLDDLTRHMGSGQFGEADRVLQLALAEGESPVAILRHMQNYFLKLHITKARLAKGETLDAALIKLRPPLFFKLKDAFVAQMNGWTMAQLEQAMALLMTVEAKCKQSGAEPETLVSRAVLSLAQLGARATGQRRRA